MERERLPPIVRLAASTGVETPVRSYLRSGRDPNATDSRRRTLLLLAATAGHADVCRLLIESGADPTLRDGGGDDALSAAIRNHHAEAVRVLQASLAPPPASTQARTDGGSSSSGNPANDLAADPDDDDQTRDLDDWEEQPDPAPPPDAPELRVSTTELQNQISEHVPIDSDYTWADVEIELPESATRVEDAVWFDEVRRFIRHGLSWGWVTRLQVAEVAGRNGAGEGREEVEIDLRLVLGGVGITVDEDTQAESMIGLFWRTWSEEPPGEEGDSGIIDEAIVFLRASRLSRDALTSYRRDIQRIEAASAGRLRASPGGVASRGVAT